jgi:hypothetical protein
MEASSVRGDGSGGGAQWTDACGIQSRPDPRPKSFAILRRSERVGQSSRRRAAREDSGPSPHTRRARKEIEAMLVLKHVYPAHGSDGKTYEVHVYAESADDGHPPIEKLKSVVLADGRDLRVVGKGHYELPDGSLKLESHDPEAI